MQLTVQVVIENDAGEREDVAEVVTLTRGALCPEQLGLTLAEAQAMLEGIQRALVTQQAKEVLAAHAHCSDCGRRRSRKSQHDLVVRTPFGKLRLVSRQLYHCRYRRQATRAFSPLADALPERTTPELAYLETKFAALASYDLTLANPPSPVSLRLPV